MKPAPSLPKNMQGWTAFVIAAGAGDVLDHVACVMFGCDYDDMSVPSASVYDVVEQWLIENIEWLLENQIVTDVRSYENSIDFFVSNKINTDGNHTMYRRDKNYPSPEQVEFICNLVKQN